MKICSNYKITHTMYSICPQFNHQNMLLQNSPGFFFFLFFPPSWLLRVKKQNKTKQNPVRQRACVFLNTFKKCVHNDLLVVLFVVFILYCLWKVFPIVAQKCGQRHSDRLTMDSTFQKDSLFSRLVRVVILGFRISLNFKNCVYYLIDMLLIFVFPLW